MKKLFILLCILPNIVICQPLWIFVEKDSYSTTYYNKNSTQKNQDNEYYVEILNDYFVKLEGIYRDKSDVDDELIYDTSINPLSIIDGYVIRCKEPMRAHVTSAHYSKNMGKGKKIFKMLDLEAMWQWDCPIGNVCAEDNSEPVPRFNKMFVLVRKMICK